MEYPAIPIAVSGRGWPPRSDCRRSPAGSEESQGPDLNRRWAALQAAALGQTLPPWRGRCYTARPFKRSGRTPCRGHAAVTWSPRGSPPARRVIFPPSSRWTGREPFGARAAGRGTRLDHSHVDAPESYGNRGSRSTLRRGRPVPRTARKRLLPPSSPSSPPEEQGNSARVPAGRVDPSPTQRFRGRHRHSTVAVYMLSPRHPSRITRTSMPHSSVSVVRSERRILLPTAATEGRRTSRHRYDGNREAYSPLARCARSPDRFGAVPCGIDPGVRHGIRFHPNSAVPARVRFRYASPGRWGSSPGRIPVSRREREGEIA